MSDAMADRIFAVSNMAALDAPFQTIGQAAAAIAVCSAEPSNVGASVLDAAVVTVQAGRGGFHVILTYWNRAPLWLYKIPSELRRPFDASPH